MPSQASAEKRPRAITPSTESREGRRLAMNQSKPLALLLATTSMLACFALAACATERIVDADRYEATEIVAPAAGLECSTKGAGCTCR